VRPPIKKEEKETPEERVDEWSCGEKRVERVRTFAQ